MSLSNSGSFVSGGRDLSYAGLSGSSPVFSTSASYHSDPSLLSVGVTKDDFSKLLSQLLSTMQQTNSTSAYDAAIAAAKETNSFNAQQAALNRLFQQTSAEKAMEFSADQAAIDRDFQQTSAEKAMEFSADQVRQQMDFEERMVNSVYQRAVKDLKAAGLSPLLAYSNLQTSAASGSSASGVSASGSRASGSSASGSSASGVKADVTSALDVERKSIDRLLSMITLNVNSALALTGQTVKLIDAIIPG